MAGAGPEPAQARPRLPAWLVRVGLLAIAAVVLLVVVRLLGRIDWVAVGDALGRLSWWQPLVLLAALLVRQVLNALPLSFYIPGVSVYRATVNDQGAILMSTIAPPPSDIALRVAMFTSWGVPVATGLAGTVMNTLTFYIVRFATPAVGFVLLAITGGDVGLRWLDLLSIALSGAILWGVLVVVRSERLARTVGLEAGRAARRVRRSIDPHAWAQRCLTFREDIASTFRRGFPRSLLALCGMILVDFTMLVLCLRFVGASSTEIGTLHVAVAYLFAYPFTLFPFAGIGIVDAFVLAALVEAGGTEVEAVSVAALLVWRIFTVAGPVLMGGLAVALWRRSVARLAHP